MNIHVFPFKVKHQSNNGVKRRHQIRLVVQTLESSEWATSEIVPLAKQFSKPLVVRARDSCGGHTEGEKGKKLSQVLKKMREGKKNTLCLNSFKWICYFERFRILEF